MNMAVLIPALNPDEALVELIQELDPQTVQIIVVDDGSAPECSGVFARLEALGCTVLHHDVNRGKGVALRTGMEYISRVFPQLDGVVTADSDGQHRPADILSVAQRTERCPDTLVLGVRDFSGSSVPPKSRFGNRFSSAYFRLSTGVRCPDTQTGLRGIRRELWGLALSVEGDRYDYEMNFLTQCALAGKSLELVPIETVYENNNSGSHFHPIRDSARIYRTALRYVATSLGTSLVDLILFTVLTALTAGYARIWKLLLGTVLARVVSGSLNFGINRRWSFHSRADWRRQGARYLVLFVIQMLSSWLLVYLLGFLPVHATVLKVIADTALFFVGYTVQHRWVFREKG